MWSRLFDGVALIAAGLLGIAMVSGLRGKYLVLGLSFPVSAILVGSLIILRNFAVF